MSRLVWLAASLFPTAAFAVVGGQDAAGGDWPDFVGVVGTSVGADPDCGGVLISPRWVLTSSVCGSSAVEVLAAMVDASTGQRIAVAQAHSHPNWLDSYDIGLLELAADAPSAGAQLALGCALDGFVDGSTVEVVGLGAIDQWGKSWPDTLQEAALNVVDHDCSTPASGCTEAVAPGGEFIAGGDGVGPCYGDSGSPAYLRTAHGDYVVGIDSRGVSGASVPCGDGAILARADAVHDWIETTSGLDLDEPDCEIQGDTDDTDDTDDGDDPDDDCGCSAGPVGGGLVFGLVALGLRRRRRTSS